MQGRIQDFKLGGGALKKNCAERREARNLCWVFRVKNHDFTPKNHIFSNCGGRREHFRGISCEKSRFYAKKSYFFQLRREARTFSGYFVWKITILRQKIIFFSNFRGGGGGRAPGAPPWIRPCIATQSCVINIIVIVLWYIVYWGFCQWLGSVIIYISYWSFYCGLLILYT